jgi:hypothetical protein
MQEGGRTGRFFVSGDAEKKIIEGAKISFVGDAFLLDAHNI